MDEVMGSGLQFSVFSPAGRKKLKSEDLTPS
jgi:hypothetical protein